MRRKTLFVLIVGTLLLCLGSAYGFENEPEGFRGLKWGDPPTEDMTLLGKLEGQRRVYTLPKEKLSLGDAWFYGIAYVFYAQPGRLMGVFLYFEGEKNYDVLETICKYKFGEETKEGFNELNWISQNTMVRLSYDMIKEKGCLNLGSNTIMMECKKEMEKKQVEGAEEDW